MFHLLSPGYRLGGLMNIQFASVGDSADLLEIYRKYIDTPITF